ncbi:baseplate J/gp47 family protein [Thermomonospora amylolytica]|uniref:baseplate J/gp47 family protein n=1 Tax=Thermomonospora amylolytica TaxID=1411117 RepID=UPI000E6C6AB0|nr:baseplate J/gp47 family protein [Thermomonospora amylolytica]
MEERLTVPGRPFDYRARDAESLLRAMRELIPRKLPEWTGHQSEADFGNVLLELFAHVGDIIGYYIDAVANESFLGTTQTRRSAIEHLRLIGYRLSTAAPASAELTLTVPAPLTENVVIRQGDAFSTGGRPGAPSVRFEYVRRDDLALDSEMFEEAGDGMLRTKAGIPVEEGRLVREEVLGVSDGTAHQRFPLAHHGLILRSPGAAHTVTPDLVVESSMGEDRVPWTLRDTLAFSGREERDVIVEIDAEDRAEIVFGEAVPDAGEQVRATYRVGGGEHGNVAGHTIRTIVDAPRLSLLGAQVTNPAPATGGAERETVEHAVRHAPTVFRSLRRAVTAADYEALALAFGGVGKVRAEAADWNTVVLYVAPQGGGAVSDVLAANLIANFEDRRPVNTRIEIESAEYPPVFITADVDVDAYHSRNRVGEQVRQAVRAVLAFDAVEFGQVVYLSKVYEAIEAVAGVEGVTISEFRGPGQAEAVHPLGKLVMKAHEVPRIPAGPDDFDKHPQRADPADYPEGVQVRASGGFA